jgi:hypothetical protein
MKIWPLCALWATTFAIVGALAGCGDAKTQTMNGGTPASVDTKPTAEGAAAASDPKTPNAGDSNTSENAPAAAQQPAAQPTTSATVALALTDLKLLANDNAGGLVGVTAVGTGFSNVNFPGRMAYKNENVGAAQQFSIRSESHVLLTEAGVKFLSGAITKAAADAAAAVAYPASFSGTSKVIGIAKDLAILSSGNSVAIFAAGAAPVVSALPTAPTAFGAPLGAGKATAAAGASGFWFMSATKLAILGKGAGETAYSWTDPSNITVATPPGEPPQALHVKISLATGTIVPDPSYFALTNKLVHTLTSSQAGDAQSGSASQTAVGSNQ